MPAMGMLPLPFTILVRPALLLHGFSSALSRLFSPFLLLIPFSAPNGIYSGDSDGDLYDGAPLRQRCSYPRLRSRYSPILPLWLNTTGFVNFTFESMQPAQALICLIYVFRRVQYLWPRSSSNVASSLANLRRKLELTNGQFMATDR